MGVNKPSLMEPRSNQAWEINFNLEMLVQAWFVSYYFELKSNLIFSLAKHEPKRTDCISLIGIIFKKQNYIQEYVFGTVKEINSFPMKTAGFI